MTTQLSERVRATVAATLDLPDAAVTSETSAENCDVWDSLAHVNVMMAIEQTFGIQLEVEDFMLMTSVERITEHLEAHGVV